MSHHFLIAGAGPGGLSAALALAQAGQRVDVFEVAARIEPLGAGLQLSPNATRRLRDLGVLDKLLETAGRPAGINIRSGISGERLAHLPLGVAAERRWGAPYVVCHRAKLHNALWQACEIQPQIKLHLNAAAQRYEVKGKSVHLHTAQGAFTGDALIGADGVDSPIRAQFLKDGPPRQSRCVAYRALVPGHCLPPGIDRESVSLWLGPGWHAVHYFLPEADALNVVVVVEEPRRMRAGRFFKTNDIRTKHPHPTLPLPGRGKRRVLSLSGMRDIGDDCLRKAGVKNKNSACGGAETDDFISVLADAALSTSSSPLKGGMLGGSVCGSCIPSICASELAALFNIVEDWSVWPLYDRMLDFDRVTWWPLPITLLGDAAHPLLPFLAQGAAMAVEDAVALADAVTRHEKIIPAFGLYQHARRERIRRVQQVAARNQARFHAGGLVALARNIYLKHRSPERLMKSFDWLFGG